MVAAIILVLGGVVAFVVVSRSGSGGGWIEQQRATLASVVSSSSDVPNTVNADCVVAHIVASYPNFADYEQLPSEFRGQTISKAADSCLPPPTTALLVCGPGEFHAFGTANPAASCFPGFAGSGASLPPCPTLTPPGGVNAYECAHRRP